MEDFEEETSLAPLAQAFEDQLRACLEECMRGRRGLFSAIDLIHSEGNSDEWPEAARLRELALALQQVYAQQESRFPLADEFLDLCSIHGEANPGERKLARAFLDRIERGHVGSPTEETPW